MRKAEVQAMQQQLEQFSYPIPEMEDGYVEFKRLAGRSNDALDDALDADAFVAKYGKDKARSVIEGAASVGGMTNNEVLDTYRLRYRTEQAVKEQIGRMKGSTGTGAGPENNDMLAYGRYRGDGR